MALKARVVTFSGPGGDRVDPGAAKVPLGELRLPRPTPVPAPAEFDRHPVRFSVHRATERERGRVLAGVLWPNGWVSFCRVPDDGTLGFCGSWEIFHKIYVVPALGSSIEWLDAPPWTTELPALGVRGPALVVDLGDVPPGDWLEDVTKITDPVIRADAIQDLERRRAEGAAPEVPAAPEEPAVPTRRSHPGLFDWTCARCGTQVNPQHVWYPAATGSGDRVAHAAGSPNCRKPSEP